MANITKRTSKTGKVSYRIRVFVGENVDGKQLYQSMTWTPPPAMRPTSAEKEAKRVATLFEEKVRSGVLSLDGKTRFADYAARWLEVQTHEPKTLEQYEYLLTRINKVIGHIPLEKLRADHLQDFYKTLREDGSREVGTYAVAEPGVFKAARKKANLSQVSLAESAGLTVFTVAQAEHGKHVSVGSANKLAEALSTNTSALFTVTQNSTGLSDATVWHHHKLIRTILGAAKREQIVPHNVASEFMKGPPRPDTEIKCLDDEQAATFITALVDEPSPQVKMALTLAMFTGLRRGELCGLSWSDVDEEKSIIYIRHTSQYISGKGVMRGKTKNKSSVRTLTITPFVLQALREYRQWWVSQKLMHGADWQGHEQYLFIQAGGKPIFPSTIYAWLQQFLQRNGLPRVSLHSLRHTNLTLLIAKGVDIKTIQSRSGHAKATTLLNTYAHFIENTQVKAAEALDDVLLRNIKPG